MRDLLNQHPSIGLPVVENKFIPYMVRRFGERPNFDDAAERRRFCAALGSTGFFAYMQASGLVFEPGQLEPVADRTSWCSILEAIFRHYGRTPERGIWGDKTPQHLYHMELLKKLWPSARFIHIIRDPRDRCLSVRKKSGTSILRGAERWRRNVAHARQAGAVLGRDYREVFYEALVSQPAVAKARCRHCPMPNGPGGALVNHPEGRFGNVETAVFRHSSTRQRRNASRYLTSFASPFKPAHSSTRVAEHLAFAGNHARPHPCRAMIAA